MAILLILFSTCRSCFSSSCQLPSTYFLCNKIDLSFITLPGKVQVDKTKWG